MKRVLLVAPADTMLPGAFAEVQNVVNSGLSVRLLTSNATEDKIADELSLGSYKVLWFATHTTGEQIQLSSKAQMSTSTLTQILRGTTIELLFLNTCASLSIAQEIQDEAEVTVIATVTEVVDTIAYRTGSLFARRLAQSGDYRSAFEASKPGRNRTYVYLDSYRKLRRVNDEILHILKAIQEELRAITRFLGMSERQEVDATISNRYMIVIIAAALIVSLSIAFLALRLGA